MISAMKQLFGWGLVVYSIQACLYAATFSVTNLNDSGEGSLRQAIANADAAPGFDTVDATGISGTITLTTERLAIIHPLELNGPGAHLLSISGNNELQVFVVGAGAPGTIINDITITEGFVGGSGSALHANANVVLNNCVIDNNSSTVGAVLSFYNTNATLNSCTVSNNRNSSGWFTIDLSASGTLTISNSTISGNQAVGSLIRTAGRLTIENSTIANNSFNYYGVGIITCFVGTPLITSSHSIYYNPAALGAPVIDYSCTPYASSLGYNIIGDDLNSTIFMAAGDQNNTNPLLQPLTNNGGSTKTHALSPLSPAINAGNPLYAGPLLYDQRGAPHSRENGIIDIGSFEL